MSNPFDQFAADFQAALPPGAPSAAPPASSAPSYDPNASLMAKPPAPAASKPPVMNNPMMNSPPGGAPGGYGGGYGQQQQYGMPPQQPPMQQSMNSMGGPPMNNMSMNSQPSLGMMGQQSSFGGPPPNNSFGGFDPSSSTASQGMPPAQAPPQYGAPTPPNDNYNPFGGAPPAGAPPADNSNPFGAPAPSSAPPPADNSNPFGAPAPGPSDNSNLFASYGAPPAPSNDGGARGPPGQDSGYGAPPPQQDNMFGGPPSQGGNDPYGAPPSYGAPPPPQQGGGDQYADPWGAPAPADPNMGALVPAQQQSNPYAAYGAPPQQQNQHQHQQQQQQQQQNQQQVTPYGGPPQGQYGGYGAPPPGDNPYGAPPPGDNPYGAPPQQQQQNPYGAPPSHDPYGAPPQQQQQNPYGAPPSHDPYGAPPQQQNPYGAPPPHQQQMTPYGGPPAADPFSVFEQQSAPAPPPPAPPASHQGAIVPAGQPQQNSDNLWGDLGFDAPPVAEPPAPSPAADQTHASSGHQDEKKTGEDSLPAGGEYYDARIFTPTLGVMFFKPQELTDSLFLNTDQSIVDGLAERPVVAFIVEGSSARAAGVELGHVLLKVNGVDVKSPKEASRLIKEGPRPLPLLFYVPSTDVVVAEGEHMVKYDTRETTAPNSAKDWKPKYVVIGGIIAQPWMMNMYRSKSEYDIAVIETQARRPVSVKVKQFSLQGARIQNDWQGPQMVKYKNKIHPWKYIVVLPVARNPIKISSPNLAQLKPVHEGIRRVLLAQNRDRSYNSQGPPVRHSHGGHNGHHDGYHGQHQHYHHGQQQQQYNY